LNSRCRPDFQAPPGEHYISLTTTNDLAEQVNNLRLAQLKGRLHKYTAVIEGDFGREYLPTAIELLLKRGAQVMLLNNDSSGRWVNGSIGEISDIARANGGQDVIQVILSDGDEVDVTPYTWEVFRFSIEDNQLRSETVGKFTQYPITLAWAVTIHKSQGKTFDRVIIDFGRGTFAHGQAYVALSRCTSLSGIVLKRPIRLQDILMDFNVIRFLTKYQYRKAEETVSLEDKIGLIKRAIKDKAALEITYLKPNDEKSRRAIMPYEIGEMEYLGKTYMGVRAFCLMRGEDRTFRVDRILEIKRRN
jgi:ATP-dependent DNA helicase PIF1